MLGKRNKVKTGFGRRGRNLSPWVPLAQGEGGEWEKGREPEKGASGSRGL